MAKFKVTFVIELEDFDLDEDGNYDILEVAEIALEQLQEEDGNGDLLSYVVVDKVE